MGLVAWHIQEEQGEKRPLAKKCKIGENRNTVNYTVKRHTNSSKISLYRNVNDSGLFRRDL